MRGKEQYRAQKAAVSFLFVRTLYRMVIYIYISIAGFHLFVNKCWQKNASAGRKFPLYGAFSGMAEVNHIKRPDPGKKPEQAFFLMHCKCIPQAGGKSTSAGEKNQPSLRFIS